MYLIRRWASQVIEHINAIYDGDLFLEGPTFFDWRWT